MPLSRSSLERQLVTAKAELEVCKKKLEASGVEVKSYPRHPAYRTLDASRKQLVKRLNALTAIEKLDADLKLRKSGESTEAA